MFDALSDRLEGILGRLRSRGRLSDADVDEALREIRTALLEADVDVGVARTFVDGDPRSGSSVRTCPGA